VSAIVFGQAEPCPDCGGQGTRAMNDAERNERSRELRIAKRRREEPPPIVKRSCDTCNGTGLSPVKGKYV